MRLSEENVLSILQSVKQFSLPIYQRHYSWEKEQCSQLWEDIVRLEKNPAQIIGNNHFIGSIVNIEDHENQSKFTLIDGQQRMATLTLILIVIRDYARNNPDSDIKAVEIENKYLKNDGLADEEKYKLVLTGEDRDILHKLVNGNFDFAALEHPDDEDEAVIPRLVANYNFFKQKLEFQNPELTPQQLYDALGKLKIVNITLGDDDDPQAIFESLNSSGKDLSKSDLIRNFVLMRCDRNTMTSIYNRYWSRMERLFGNSERNTAFMDDFFKDYLTMQYARIPNEDQIYEEFKTWFYQALSVNRNKINTICKELYERAQDYTNIKFARHENLQIRSVYAEIKNLKMEVSYPFLLKIHKDFRKKLITEEQLLQIMYMCITQRFLRIET